MKRILKKGISVFLVVAMLLCAAPLNGFVGIQLPNFSSIFATKVGAADSGYGSVLASGSHGSKVTYVYYEDGIYVGKTYIETKQRPRYIIEEELK